MPFTITYETHQEVENKLKANEATIFKIVDRCLHQVDGVEKNGYIVETFTPSTNKPLMLVDKKRFEDSFLFHFDWHVVCINGEIYQLALSAVDKKELWSEAGNLHNEYLEESTDDYGWPVEVDDNTRFVYDRETGELTEIHDWYKKIADSKNIKANASFEKR